MINGFGNSATLSLFSATSKPGGLTELLTASTRESEAIEEKTKAMASIAETLDRMTDPAAKLSRAQATLQREMTRAETELEALKFLKVIDPEAAARAAEDILARLDRAVSAYSASVKSLSSNAISSSYSPESTANALKAAAQKVLSQQPAPEAPPDVPDPEAVRAQLKSDLLAQIDQIKLEREEALDALKLDIEEVAVSDSKSKSHDEFLESLRQLVTRIASVAEGAEDDDEGEDPAVIEGRIRESIQKAAQAVTSLLRSGKISELPKIDARL